MNPQRPLLVVGLMALSQTLPAESVSVRNIVVQPTSVRQGRQTTVRFSARATHPEHAVVMLQAGFFTDGVWGQGRLLQTTPATKADDGETWTAELRVPADVPAGTKRVYTWFRLANGAGHWLRHQWGTLLVVKDRDQPVQPEPGTGRETASAPVRQSAAAAKHVAAFRKRLAASLALRRAAADIKALFPVGVYYYAWGKPSGVPYEKGTPEQVKRELTDIKAHGLNAIAVFGAGKIPDRKRLLEIAADVGLKVMPFDDNTFWALREAQGPVTEELILPHARKSVDALAGYASLLGYKIYDEPALGACAAVGVAARVYEKLDPSHPVIVTHNLPGAHRGPLRARQDRIGSIVFVHDNYQPLVSAHNDDPLRAAMAVGVDEAYAAASAYDIPLWVVLSAKNETGDERRARSLRARVYLALAHGAKGILYFPYQTVGNPTRPQQGLLRPDGSATPAWDEFGRLGKELETLGPLVLKLERKASIVAADPPIDAQALVHGDGTTYLVVANLDLDNPQRTAVRFRQGLVSERAVNVLDGTNVALTEDGLTLDLKPGEALFLKLHQPE